MLSTLVKVATVLTIGGGGVTAYYLTNNTEHSSSKTYDHDKWDNTCKKPYLVTMPGGVTMEVESEDEGWNFLKDSKQDQGKVEKCSSYKESK